MFSSGSHLASFSVVATCKKLSRTSGRGTSEGRKHDQMRSVLVVSEVALSFVLLVSAGLLLRSFLHVLDVELGFQPSQAYSMQVDYDDGGNAAKRGAILQDILRRVKRHPGIEAAGFTDMLPLRPQSKLGPVGEGICPPEGRRSRRDRANRDARLLASHGYTSSRRA